MGVKNGVFSNVSGVNEIPSKCWETIFSEFNICKFNGKLIYLENYLASTLQFRQADSLTATPTDLTTIALTAGGTYAYAAVCIKVIGDTLYIVVTFETSTHYEISTAHTTNLVDWTTNNSVVADPRAEYPFDIFDIGGTIYIMTNYWDTSESHDITFYTYSDLAAVISDTDTALDGSCFTTGRVYDSKYWYAVATTTTNLRVKTFNGAALATDENITIAEITRFEPGHSIMFVKANFKFIHFGTDDGPSSRFYLYNIPSDKWLVDIASETYANACHLWSETYNLNFLIADETMYRVSSGGLRSFQKDVGAGWVGYDDFFIPSNSTAKQLTPTAWDAHSLIVTYEVEKPPLAKSLTLTSPTEESYIFYDDSDNQIFEGFRELPTTQGGLVATKYTSGIAFDLKTIVSIDATNTTPHAWIKAIIDTYCSFMYYDSGIDDTFGAMDLPSINGKTVSYCFRFISILKSNWFYFKPDMEVYWDDGTVDSGKDIEWGTEPVF